MSSSTTYDILGNVSKTSCKTDFKTFLKNSLKAIAKLVNVF